MTWRFYKHLHVPGPLGWKKMIPMVVIPVRTLLKLKHVHLCSHLPCLSGVDSCFESWYPLHPPGARFWMAVRPCSVGNCHKNAAGHVRDALAVTRPCWHWPLLPTALEPEGQPLSSCGRLEPKGVSLLESSPNPKAKDLHQVFADRQW